MLDITSKPGSTTNNPTGGWRTYIPKTDYKTCISCGMCAKICPENAIKMVKQKDGTMKPVTDYKFCKGCGLCAKHCPVKAIEMNKDIK